jgi:uncharacterized membrane protein YfhO
MKKNSPLIYDRNEKEKYLVAFLLGFGILLFSLLPIIIADKGYFIYYGDYNSQQIHFYKLANNAVRSGSFGWNWFTDLGSDFIGSYSFYLLGSPFFWLSVILPKALVTYSMPVLLALKHGFAALTAYAYARRFVRSKNAALIGSLLYAFSGFQTFNIFFNHFQDVTAFFPLMLIAMEECINNNKRGLFALTVALMAIINYFFFTGQVVFLIIYFFVRLGCEDFKATWKKFGRLAVEAVLGTMLAAFLLLPSALAILENQRVSEHLYGLDMVLYGDKTRIARIIQSFFMPPDVPARPNLFVSDYGKWASIGGYLPLFSMAGVIAFMQKNKKHWASKLIIISIICAFVPILNSGFYMFNGSYYARWFYMPILIMSVMTAQAIDDDEIDFKGGIKICGAFLASYAIICCLPKKKDDKTVFFEITGDLGYFLLTLGIAFASLIALVYIAKRKKLAKPFMETAVVLTVTASIGCTLATVIYGACTPSTAAEYIDASINGKDSVYEEVSEDNFFRVDMSENYDNYPMTWELPSMRAFQSVVSASIMDFYHSIGVTRDVASRADTSHYTLRGLFSVKYYYQKTSDNEKVEIEKELPGFKYLESNEYFDIYENTLYIPMGFAYNTYITQESADKMSASMRERIMIKSLILSDKQAEKYNDILTETKEEDYIGLSKSAYMQECMNKKLNSSSEFEFDSYSFKSKITLDKDSLVFFSVPYNSGWTAKVNGKNADVERVSNGFMAVKAYEGENTIEFSYRTSGLYEGFIISIIGLIGFIAYMLITRKNKNDTYPHTHYYGYNSSEKLSASLDYYEEINSKFGRK